MTHVAVLKNLPPDIKAIDLGPIYSEVGASSIGWPRYVKSYKSKPWAYFAFKSQEMRDQAMELSCALKGKKLTWILPAEVKNLCVRCAAPEHKTQHCKAFEDRGRKSIPKAILHNYDRFKLVGYKQPKETVPKGKNNTRPRSASRSRSRSRSRATKNQEANKNTNNNHQNKKSSNEQQSRKDSNKQPKSVSYADAASASASLNASQHSPGNRTNIHSQPGSSTPRPPPYNQTQNKDKGKAKETQATADDRYASRDSLAQLAAAFVTVQQQFKEIQTDFETMKHKFDQIDNRLDNIERFCQAAASAAQPVQTKQARVPIPTSPILPPITPKITSSNNSFPLHARSTSQVGTMGSSPPQQASQQQQPASTVSRTEFDSAMGKMDNLGDTIGHMAKQFNNFFNSTAQQQ